MFEVIPHKRDATAKFAYLFFRRFMRINRKQIEKASLHTFIHGQSAVKLSMKDGELLVDCIALSDILKET